jgi:hypothetical protein
MTNEEVMQILTDMGLHEGGMDNWVVDNAWWKFANVVEQHEREACAKLCEKMWHQWLDSPEENEPNKPDAEDCYRAIRARGQT